MKGCMIHYCSIFLPLFITQNVSSSDVPFVPQISVPLGIRAPWSYSFFNCQKHVSNIHGNSKNGSILIFIKLECSFIRTGTPSLCDAEILPNFVRFNSVLFWESKVKNEVRKCDICCPVSGVCVINKTGFGFDDRIYWTFMQLITTFEKSLSDTLSSSSDWTPTRTI
jgi:hypothetical protein